ncbi:hypothetical protein SCLCIDRAFT_959852 [Scleroderma citrinum Foug A]|uniref:Uncharacterized protein n=1 Tax=Scleroderma citrinum Foug A TaxID=1036808 RepID=A0A0C3DVR2_9AGAM|nr:hypothetical protein SCLCIDRAFT_959852 [Scleroderma citrinum Foug A]
MQCGSNYSPSCSVCNVKIGLDILCCHHFHPDCDVDKFLFRFFFFLAFSCTSHSQTKSLGRRVSGCPLIVSSALQRNIIHPTSPENLCRASSFHIVVPQHWLYLLLADLPSLACLPQGLLLLKAFQYALPLRLIASCGGLLGFSLGLEYHANVATASLNSGALT